jgi:hypothetical protein
MPTESPETDQMQAAYRTAVEKWIFAIREEIVAIREGEPLFSRNASLPQVDWREQAQCRQKDARKKVKAAKREYDAALRSRLFDFH